MNELEAVKLYYSNFNNGHAIYDCNKYIARMINAIEPERVLDFGCGTGKNLNLIEAEERVGIDISIPALKEGMRIYDGIMFVLGDENRLRYFDDKYFDVSYTVSVLNHIPSPAFELVVIDLKRISKVIYSIESKDKWTNLCFPHDYEKVGFKKLWYEWKSPGTKANYNLYKLED